MPVFRAEGGHEDAEDLEETAGKIGRTEETIVGGSAGEGSNEKEEEYLDAANPGDSGWRVVEGSDVVRLEDTERVDIAPGIEDHEMGHECLGPRSAAAIWGRTRIDVGGS